MSFFVSLFQADDASGHARLKNHVASMDGQLDAVIHEGGELHTSLLRYSLRY
jgi:hypothetical protein